MTPLSKAENGAISLREMKAEAAKIMKIAAFASLAFISWSEMAPFEGGVIDEAEPIIQGTTG